MCKYCENAHYVHAINPQDDVPLKIDITDDKNKSFVESINCHDEPLYYGDCIACNDNGDKLFLRTMTGDMIGEPFIHIGIDDTITGLTDAQGKLADDYCKKHNLEAPELIEYELCD